MPSCPPRKTLLAIHWNQTSDSRSAEMYPRKVPSIHWNQATDSHPLCLYPKASNGVQNSSQLPTAALVDKKYSPLLAVPSKRDRRTWQMLSEKAQSNASLQKSHSLQSASFSHMTVYLKTRWLQGAKNKKLRQLSVNRIYEIFIRRSHIRAACIRQLASASNVSGHVKARIMIHPPNRLYKGNLASCTQFCLRGFLASTLHAVSNSKILYEHQTMQSCQHCVDEALNISIILTGKGTRFLRQSSAHFLPMQKTPIHQCCPKQRILCKPS